MSEYVRDQKVYISMSRDLVSVTESVALNGATADGKNWGAVRHGASFTTGSVDTGTIYIDVVLQHSDDNSTWADCNSDDLIIGSFETASAGVVKRVEDQADIPGIYSAEYLGEKRYSRFRLEPVDCIGDITGSMWYMKEEPRFYGDSGSTIFPINE